MYEIRFTAKFHKSYKKVSNSIGFSIEKFDQIIVYFETRKELPRIFHDHSLAGNFASFRECHISGNCILIYEINHDDKYVRLYNIGNHANMFE